MTREPVEDGAFARDAAARTIAEYEAIAEGYRAGTWDHDVSQNRAALLEAIEGEPPFSILDLGCGPGRDLCAFRALGHAVVGLDGAAPFVTMARAASGCEVWHQDFLALDLPAAHFDGVFANASLFHVPQSALPRVLRDIATALKPGGVLFSSNPHGMDDEGWCGGRYGCFLSLETWCDVVQEAGFIALTHYHRPPGRPRAQQPWLATVFQRAQFK